jgi:hypothetical protein
MRSGQKVVLEKRQWFLQQIRSKGDLLAIVARPESQKVCQQVLSMSGTKPLDTGTVTGMLMLAFIGAVGRAERRGHAGAPVRGRRPCEGSGATRGVYRPHGIGWDQVGHSSRCGSQHTTQTIPFAHDRRT